MMKRLSLLAASLAIVGVLAWAAPKPASADLNVGFPQSVNLWEDLNLLGASYIVYTPTGVYACKVNVYGTFVATLDVYTSANGTFSDAVKQGAALTAPTTATLNFALPVGTKAFSVQNRAFTSGDPSVGIDCLGGNQNISAGVVEPTPAATP